MQRSVTRLGVGIHQDKLFARPWRSLRLCEKSVLCSSHGLPVEAGNQISRKSAKIAKVSQSQPCEFTPSQPIIGAIEKKVTSGIARGEDNSAVIGFAAAFCDEAGRGDTSRKTLCETLAIFAPLREIGAVQFARIVGRGREPNLSQRRKDRQGLAKSAL